jgi:hypothetical protein|tara:strand:- start:48 stop:248 length:201 start_codon:yes stop_codon:yes gene_type:complete
MARPKSTNTLSEEILELATRFQSHEYHCEKARADVQFQLRRLEWTIIGTSGSIIAGLCAIVYGLIF